MGRTVAHLARIDDCTHAECAWSNGGGAAPARNFLHSGRLRQRESKPFTRAEPVRSAKLLGSAAALIFTSSESMAATESSDGGARSTGAPVRASGSEGETHWRCGPVDGVTVGSNSRLVDAEFRAELRLTHGRLIRGPGYAAAPRPTRQLLARVGAMLKLREHARYHVHAAGVVAPDGGAWLLTGESGCGKSTLTYALARRGWPVLGDDGVVLERTSPGPIAHGWHEPLRVSIELAAWFPELSQRESLVNWQDARHRVAVDATFMRRAMVAGVVVLQRGERDVLSALSPTAALAMLVRQSTFLLVTDDHARSHLGMLRDLVESVPCFMLQHTAAQLTTVHATILAAK